MAQSPIITVQISTKVDTNAEVLFALAADVDALYDLIPPWCSEAEPIRERIGVRFRRLVKVARGQSQSRPRGGA